MRIFVVTALQFDGLMLKNVFIAEKPSAIFAICRTPFYMKDFRKTRGEVFVDSEVISQGELQLLGEIALIESWLKTLDAQPPDDLARVKSRTIYQDMLRSRQDMLAILRKQAK